jgi:hypothetical protein
MITKQLIRQNKYIFHHITLILIFSFLYYKFQAKEDNKRFKDWEEAVYFAVVTHFTVGFGDISPKSKLLRRLCMLQIFIAFTLFMS